MAAKPSNKSASEKKKKRKQKKKPTFIEQARRKQILAEASRSFSTSGYDATSLDDIAKSVGISRGVIFYYFEGKREIGEQIVRQCLRKYGSYVQERVNDKLEGKEQLLEFIDACLDYLDNHREDYLLYVDLIGCFGNTQAKYDVSVSANQRTREWLISMIQAGQKQGEISDVPATNLADVVQGVVDGLMELSALDKGSVNIAGCKTLIRQMILNTIT